MSKIIFILSVVSSLTTFAMDFNEAATRCRVSQASFGKLNNTLQYAIMDATKLKDLQKKYDLILSFETHVGSQETKALAERGIRVVTVAGSIGTAEGNLCAVVSSSGLSFVRSIDGAKRIGPFIE